MAKAKSHISKHQFKNHGEAWKKFRNGGVGGSDAGTIAGLNGYQTPYGLWAEKTGRVEAFEGNVATEVGNYLEDFVAKRFELQTGKKVKKVNATYTNSRFPWAVANVDRLVVGEDAILEIKTTTNHEYARRLKAGEIVPAWWAQITHYMTILEKPKAFLAALVDCREVIVLEFDFDPDESSALMSAEEEFWNHVVEDTPPPIDGFDPTTEAIQKIYSVDDGGEMELFGMDNTLMRYSALTAEISRLNTERDELTNEIKVIMGDCAKASNERFRVNWKTQTRRTFDTKAFMKDHEDMDLSQYYKESVSRPFKITEIKKEN